MAKHLSSHEAFANLSAAKEKLKQAKKDKKPAAEIKKLEKEVNNAQAVANLF